MDSMEPKKLALLRILQILQDETDFEHPLTQEGIAKLLDTRYGIAVERKAIGRNLSLLKEAGFGIESDKRGSYLAERAFEDSELRLLIDGVLASRHIAAKHSKELIGKLSGLSNRHFKRHIKHIYSVNDWNKTDAQTLFLFIDLIDEAIENKKMIEYDYNKYGSDRKLHKSSFQRVSPYQLILHNQRYYLMGYSKHWEHLVFHRLDRMSNMVVSEQPLTPLRSLPGYENGIDYRRISSSLPYMFTDDPERITFVADSKAMDQIVDWFGTDILVEETDGTVRITVSASPRAMVYWALQYADFVTVLSPAHLRDEIARILEKAGENYKKEIL